MFGEKIGECYSWRKDVGILEEILIFEFWILCYFV